MKSAELLRKLSKLARTRNLLFESAPGKGSHRKVKLGERMTIVPVHNAELKTGTLKAILKDLAIREEEL